MDAIALLKADHKTVETLFRKFEQAAQDMGLESSYLM
jgi:hypothetical protein